MICFDSQSGNDRMMHFTVIVCKFASLQQDSRRPPSSSVFYQRLSPIQEDAEEARRREAGLPVVDRPEIDPVAPFNRPLVKVNHTATRIKCMEI